jgi:hypothetical protein
MKHFTHFIIYQVNKKIRLILFLTLEISIGYATTPISLSVTSSKGSNICKGDQVTFVATASGDLPICTVGTQFMYTHEYDWTINGKPAFTSSYGTSNPNPYFTTSFVTSDLKDGDQVVCTYSYNLFCISGGSINHVNAGASSPPWTFIVYSIDASSFSIIQPPNGEITGGTYIYSATAPTTNSPSLTYTWNLGSGLGSYTHYGTDGLSIQVNVDPGAAQKLPATYSVGLSAVSSACPSNVVNAPVQYVTITNPVPSTPSIPVVTGSNPSDQYSVNLSWSKSTDNTGVKDYIVYYTDAGTNQNGFQTIPAGTTDPVTATITSLSQQEIGSPHSYTFSVVAEDDYQGVSMNSGTSLPYIIDHEAPNPPLNFVQIEQTDNTATFTWTPGSDNVGVTGYYVYKDGGTTPIATIGTNNIYSILFSSLPTDFSIKAFDAKGNTSTKVPFPSVTQPVDPFTIDPATGFVGIGVKPPSEKLDIDGNLKVRGNIILDKVVKTEPDVMTFTGASLDIYTPSQGQYNGQKPIISMTQWGEIKFNSTPYLNYNDIKFLGTGNYKNGIGFRDSFGQVNGIGGPALFGENGGVLGTKQGSWDGPEQTALKWDQSNNVSVTGALYNTGLPQGSKPIEDPWITQGFTSNNPQYPSYQSELTLRQYWKTKVTVNTPEFQVNGEMNSFGGYRVAGRDMHSGNPDVINNAPYYGIGMSNKILSGTIAAVQVAGYGGVILTDNTGVAVSVYNGNTQVKGNLDFVGDLSHNGSPISLISMVNNYNIIQGNTNVTGTFKVGTNSLIINGYNGNPITGTANINEIYSNFVSEPLYINKTNGANTIINPNTGTVSIGTTDAGSSYLTNVKLNIGGSLVVSNSIALGSLSQNNTYGQSYISTSSTNDILFYTNGGNNQVLSLGNNGNILLGGNTGINTSTPRAALDVKGKVIIGNKTITTGTDTDFQLSVDGKIVSTKVIVTDQGWSDHVFNANYKLKTLEEVNDYIKQNHHLADIPSEIEISKNGIDTGEMLKLHMAKIEELTLYLIQQEKKIKNLEIQLLKK